MVSTLKAAQAVHNFVHNSAWKPIQLQYALRQALKLPAPGGDPEQIAARTGPGLSRDRYAADAGRAPPRGPPQGQRSLSSRSRESRF